eukprot:477536-Amphidinium_carterae.6
MSVYSARVRMGRDLAEKALGASGRQSLLINSSAPLMWPASRKLEPLHWFGPLCQTHLALTVQLYPDIEASVAQLQDWALDRPGHWCLMLDSFCEVETHLSGMRIAPSRMSLLSRCMEYQLGSSAMNLPWKLPKHWQSN